MSLTAAALMGLALPHGGLRFTPRTGNSSSAATHAMGDPVTLVEWSNFSSDARALEQRLRSYPDLFEAALVGSLEAADIEAPANEIYVSGCIAHKIFPAVN